MNVGVAVTPKPITMEGDRRCFTNENLATATRCACNIICFVFLVGSLETTGYEVMIADILAGLQVLRAAGPGMSCPHSLRAKETVEKCQERLSWRPLAVDR